MPHHICLLCCVSLFFLPLFFLQAQEEKNSGPEDALDNKIPEADLNRVLFLTEEKRWEEAFALLDELEKIAPTDPRLSSYRNSIAKLAAIDATQEQWIQGKSPENKTDPEDPPPNEEETPAKFVIIRDKLEAAEKSFSTRHKIRFNLGLNLFTVNPLNKQVMGGAKSVEQFFFTSLSPDFRYWFPSSKRVFGLSFRVNGYFWPLDEASQLWNNWDVGFNFRSFLFETDGAQMELGLDVGISLQSTYPLANKQLDSTGTTLFFGLWVRDPILFHLFRIKALKPLLFGAEIRVYTPIIDNPSEIIHYWFDSIWNFKNFHVGVRFEWMDFIVDGTHYTPTTFMLIGGLHY